MVSGSMRTECIPCGKVFEGITLSCGECGVPVLRLGGMKWKVKQGIPNIWRYQHMLPPLQRRVSLGEGLTPLRRLDGTLVKLETRNPTGSYADRASAMIASYYASFPPSLPVRINYAKDFALSIASYMTGIAGVEIYLEDPGSVDTEEILTLAELGASVKFSREGDVLSYMNPLTIEGLKTIVFEIFERGFTRGCIIVPAETGLLALSMWKGLEDLREAGEEADLDIVAVHLEGTSPPEILKGIRGVRSFAISREKTLKALIELARSGIKTKLIAAAPVAAAGEIGCRRSISIITASSAKYIPQSRGSRSKLAREVLEILKEVKSGTAYEIWEALGKYTLRGVYKALVSLERSGLVRSEYDVKGRKRKKIYVCCEGDE